MYMLHVPVSSCPYGNVRSQSNSSADLRNKADLQLDALQTRRNASL